MTECRNVRFADYEYVRPDAEGYREDIRRRAEALETADERETMAIVKEQLEAADHFDSLYQVAYIRNSIDTADPFYDGEILFFNEENPRVDLAVSEFQKALLASPYRDAVEAKYGNMFLRRMQERQRLSSEESVEDKIAENRLVQEYFQVAGSCNTVFHGEKMNFYGLLKQMQSSDRNLRREAMTAWSGLYASAADQLDDIYSRMIEVRCRLAEKLGFHDYTEMIYLSMDRYDFGPEDVAAFRENIRTAVVPLVAEIYGERREKLGLDKLHYYDEAMTDPAGNVAPRGDVKELVAAAQEMYHELSAETGEFFDYMVEHELFDLVTGPTKQQGGYCTFVADFDGPFIFSNFNGTTADIDVLTHEAGHSFEAYMARREGVPLDVLFSTSEVAEIHSMSMEFFTHPWMEKFFGGSHEEADRYRYLHAQGALMTVPYMACVDEFQHRVYAERMTDAGMRRKLWHELEEKYMPWRDYDGDPFLEEGGFWMQKQHIFMCPFYYIDYAMAQMGALEFYLRDRKDHEAAWADYVKLCRAGGKLSYGELMELAGLHRPFDPETVPMLMEEMRPLVLGH